MVNKFCHTHLRQPLVLVPAVVTAGVGGVKGGEWRRGGGQGGDHEGAVDGERRLQLGAVPRLDQRPLPERRHHQLDRARLADLLLCQSWNVGTNLN